MDEGGVDADGGVKGLERRGNRPGCVALVLALARRAEWGAGAKRRDMWV